MLDDAAFLATILERPAEDAPRLVYADWLEEHGLTHRAEFIRVQVELANLPAGNAVRPALLERERELIARHGRDWLAPLMDKLEEDRKLVPPPAIPAPLVQVMQQLLGGSELRRHTDPTGLAGHPSSREWFASMLNVLVDPIQFRAPIESQFQCRFRRGFVERVELLAGDFVRHFGVLFAMAPVREITVYDSPFFGGFPDLFLCPAVGRLEGLEIQGLLALDAVREFLDCPHLKTLKRFTLERATVTRDDAEALCRADNLPSLRELNLGAVPLGDAGAFALAADFGAEQLESLGLKQTGLTDAGALALSRSVKFVHVRSLDLSHNQITGHGAVALAESPMLGQLTTLDLSHNRLADSVLQSLNRYVARFMGKPAPLPWLQRFLQSPLAARLEALFLDRNGLDPADRAAVEERLGFRVVWV